MSGQWVFPPCQYFGIGHAGSLCLEWRDDTATPVVRRNVYAMIRIPQRRMVAISCFAFLVVTQSGTAESKFPWEIAGLPYRLIIQVASPSHDSSLRGDEMPADVEMDFAAQLKDLGGGIPDLNTLHVVSLETDAEVVRKDIPWRWYDAAIGYDFQECEQNLDRNNGKLAYTSIPRFGYFYDCIGDWRAGHLAFTHRVTTSQPALYALYFDLLPPDAQPNQLPPRGFLGDGLQRCQPEAYSTTGLIHSRVEVTDWDGDGLLDLLVGCARGGMIWYRNQGDRHYPAYPVARLVHTADGNPLDIGWSSAPHAVDWDGDGRTDLLVGGEWNRVMLFHNAAADGPPKLAPAGLLYQDTGEPVFVPWQPCPEPEPQFSYQRDYYPVLTTADWDDDGDTDLLAGGYVTGRIYLFENVAEPHAAPRLRFDGPLEADGKPIDVGWAAAPTVGDLDDDGDLDLLSGSMPMTKGGGDYASSEAFLSYYRNDGTRKAPRLHRTELLTTSTLPAAALSTPRLADWNTDGPLDLVVSAGTQIYMYENIGTKQNPLFETDHGPLPCRWGGAALEATQFIDWNGDGLVDAANAPRVRLNTGAGGPGRYGEAFSVLAENQVISHLSGIGDDWRYQRFYDLNADGRVDLMDADHGGHFWWHENRGSPNVPAFDTSGVQLLLPDGTPATVGEGREGFNALQGARATFTVADFDGDGSPDLVTGDAFGHIDFFRQTSSAAAPGPCFEPSVRLGQMRTRAVPCAADWNGDGSPDVVAASSAGDVTVFVSLSNSERPFSEPQPISLPRAPYGAGAPIIVTDYNGDGDQDIILYTAYGYMCFYEHSFIDYGYARGTVVRVEKKAGTNQ